MTKYILLIVLMVLELFSNEDIRQKALQRALTPTPKDFQTLKKLVDDEQNPMSVEKIKLGKRLFFDKNLSKDRTLACAKCHDIKNGGEDGKPTAIGYNNLPNPKHLNSPTVLNTAYSKHLFWDGRASSLREQAKGPIQAHFEMASTPELVVQRVNENPYYKEMFKKIFPKEGITFDTVTKAIEVYEKTLVTRGRFDRFLEGDLDALTQKEKRGLNLFIDMGCKGCHFGVAIGGQRMQKFPLRDYNSILSITTTFNEQTKGRSVKDVSINLKMYQPYPFKNIGGFLGKNDERVFRVPILRDISKTAPYFHNGSIKTLREAIKIMAKNQIGVDIENDQLDALEAFLKSLDGELVNFNLKD